MKRWRIRNRFLRWGFRISFLAMLLSVVLVISANRAVRKQAVYTYTEWKDLPYNEVGLVLGTGKHLKNGRVNLYYQYRLEAAAELYRNGKVAYLLVSGDNGRKGYDEPTEMRNDLVALGVPASRIYRDYAGFRTLDSMVRCKEVFGQDKITVISQPFHNERAIYLARHYDVEAIGYNARGVSARYGWKTQLRERLARAKMMLDLWWGTEPRFLGKPIVISEHPPT